MKESRKADKVREEIIVLKDKYDDLVLTKRRVETDLARARGMMKAQSSYMTRLPPAEYRMWQTREMRAKSDLLKIAEEMAPIKKRIRALYEEEERGRGELMDKLNNIQEVMSSGQHSPAVEEIARLRDKWLAFAEDQTRVNSMRVMAAQFSRELTDLLASKQDLTC